MQLLMHVAVAQSAAGESLGSGSSGDTAAKQSVQQQVEMMFHGLSADKPPATILSAYGTQ